MSLYWKNPDPRRYVNVVPTSAITGEGIPDLLQLMVKLTQTMMQDRLTLLSETQCTVSSGIWVQGFVEWGFCRIMWMLLRAFDWRYHQQD